MAWLDDRIWCHPKFTGLSKPAFASWTKAICYSSGFHTAGELTESQLKTLGVSRKERRELVDAGLWQERLSTGDAGGVAIHDWEDHNGSRDAKKAADRERKRRQRDRERHADSHADEGVTTDVTKAVTSRGRPRVDRVKSEGVTEDEGSTRSLKPSSPSTEARPPEPDDLFATPAHIATVIHAAVPGQGNGDLNK